MATVVDKARPATVEHKCSMNKFTQPTPRVMENGFGVKISAAETHIPSLLVAVTPVDNKADNPTTSHPIVDDSSFFLPSSPPSGGGPAPAPTPAEPTIVVAGLNTSTVTVTITLPPGTVCDQGKITASALTINGTNRDLDVRAEPLANPAYWVGWFGDQSGDPTPPPVVGLTADQLAALWTITGPSADSNASLTCVAAGNVVTITETGGKTITAFTVTWEKTT